MKKNKVIESHSSEINFDKYKKRGAYHWEQISLHPIKRNAFVLARYNFCVRLLKKHMGESLSGKNIIDLGCGDGVLSYLLYKNGAISHGLDLSELGIEYAKKMHQIKSSRCTFHIGSVYDTGLEAESFDGIICSEVIEHLKEPDKLLGEINRILKPGGIAIISTPIRFTGNPLDIMHAYEWFFEEFQDYVRQFFNNVKFHRSHPLAWMDLYQKNRLWRILINLVSFFHNPFSSGKNWRYFVLQYAVILKEKNEIQKS